MKTHTHNNNHAVCSTPRGGRLATVCKLGRLMVMLAVVNVAATANAGNPFSVDQHKSGMTIRFEPLERFHK